MHRTIPNLFDVWADCVLHLYLYYGTPPPNRSLTHSQCDQIGLLLKDLWQQLFTKIAQILTNLLGNYLSKCRFLREKLI